MSVAARVLTLLILASRLGVASATSVPTQFPTQFPTRYPQTMYPMHVVVNDDAKKAVSASCTASRLCLPCSHDVRPSSQIGAAIIVSIVAPIAIFCCVAFCICICVGIGICVTVRVLKGRKGGVQVAMPQQITHSGVAQSVKIVAAPVSVDQAAMNVQMVPQQNVPIVAAPVSVQAAIYSPAPVVATAPQQAPNYPAPVAATPTIVQPATFQHGV